MAEKRYFWMRLPSDMFNSKRIKKLRRCAGGDTYFVIYLKMQLKSITNGGVLCYDGLEESFAEEIAADIDEDPVNVEFTLDFLIRTGLAEISEDGKECLLPYARDNTGSEGASAKRVRELRDRRNNVTEPMLPSNDCALHCNDEELPSNETALHRYGEIEIKNSNIYSKNIDTVIVDKEGVIGGDAPTPPAPETQPEDTDLPTQKQVDFEGLIRMALRLGKPAKANEYYKMAKENGVSIDVAKLKAEMEGAG